MYYTWRLRNPPTNSAAYAWLDKYDAYLVAYDNNNDDNLHVHVLISTYYKEASVRSHLDKHMNIGHGNRNRSLKKLDENKIEEFLRYMCKPQHTYLAKKGYDDGDLVKYRSEYIEFPSRKLSTNSKSRMLDIKRYIEDVCFPKREVFANEHIVEGIIQYYKHKQLNVPCMFRIKTLVMTLKLHMINGYEQELQTAYMSQLWYKNEYGNNVSL